MKNLMIKRCRASFTVEASFIVPVILFTIYMLLSLIFFLCERIRIECLNDDIVLEQFELRTKEYGLSSKHESDLTSEKTRKGYFSNTDRLFGAVNDHTELNLPERSVIKKVMSMYDSILDMTMDTEQ